MAKRGLSLSSGILFAVVAMVGCQSAPPARIMTAQLPPPKFDGPKIVPNSAAPKSLASGLTGPSAWRPTVPPRDWKWIVIHHSATAGGSMVMFDKEHRAKGWDGIGYHFVIGNGTLTGDGQIEVAPRWPIQKWGAHAKTLDNKYNERGIGICLVGNFDTAHPSAAQMKSLTTLVAYLMQTYHISPSNVIGHRDTKATACPGRWMSVATLRQQATRAVADAGGKINSDDATAQTASVELLGEVAR